MATEIITSFGQQCDSNGVPMSGAKIYVYDVGTTTLKSLFTDIGLSVSTANPIVTDASGRHTSAVGMVYVATGSYKIVVKTSADVPVYTRDYIDGRVPVGSGALAIANGGTGATTAVAALAALGAATSSEVADLAADVASLAGAAASSEKTHIAVGTTAQRPTVPVEGDIRRNTTTGKWEGYVAAFWNFFTTEDVATAAQQKTGSSAAVVVTPSVQQQHESSCKAWAHVTWSAGTPAVEDSYNIGSIVDDSVGDISFVFTANMANANFVVTGGLVSAGIATWRITARSASGFSIKIVDSGGSDVDPTGLSIAVFGTLA